MQVVSDAAVLKRQAKEIERLMRKLEESGYLHNLYRLQQKGMLYYSPDAPAILHTLNTDRGLQSCHSAVCMLTLLGFAGTPMCRRRSRSCARSCCRPTRHESSCRSSLQRRRRKGNTLSERCKLLDGVAIQV